MTERLSIDEINSDQLDALYDRLDGYEAAERYRKAATEATRATHIETTARVFAGLHRSAEADVTRVIELYERWVKEGAPPLGVPIARWWDKRLVELHDAIVPPTDQPKEK
ncbi:hypothetical protein [Streptomyces sp. NPDC005302]|uniref:hypothetical protein n=1 Tax=Streptomyces sp. NPDC005302 TaxID=3154675 RepID=UPI0033AFEE73